MGKNVKEIRIKKEIKAKYLAEQFGVSVCEQKKLEEGKKCGFCYFDILKLTDVLNTADYNILRNIEFVND